MTSEEKRIILKEITKYIKEHCYHADGSIKHDDLWLVGWVAEEFIDTKNAMKVLINNEYGLLGNLLYKLSRTPDESITRFIERADLNVLLKAIADEDDDIIWMNDMDKDPYAMRLLITHDVKYCKFLSCELYSSKPFLFATVKKCPEILPKAPLRVFEDDEFVLSLIKQNYTCLKYLPHHFRSDYRMCYEAVCQEGSAMLYLDQEIKERDEIVLAAVTNRGNALSMASPEQKKNREIVFAAVSNCGLALDYADTSLKNDPQLVATAVSKNGLALRYAPLEFRDNEEIVTLAIENDGYAIRSASDRLRDNYELAVKAISTYVDAYKYLSDRLQNDPDIMRLYKLKKEEEEKWLQSRRQSESARESC